MILLGSFWCGQVHSLERSPAGTEAEMFAFLENLAADFGTF